MTKYINYLLILFAFSLPFKFFLINGLAIVIFAMWLMEGDLLQKWQRLKQQKIFWVITGFSFITLLSFLWSDTLTQGYYNGRIENGISFWFAKLGYKLLILPVLLTHVDRKLLKQIVSAFLTAMFISEILSYGIFFELWQIKKGTVDDPTPFLHHTYYSTFLVFTIFISLVRFKREEQKGLKLFYLFFAISATINLFVNGGRTGQLAFIFSALYFVWHHYHLSIKSFLITLLTLVTLYAVAFQISPVFKQRMQYTQQSLQKLTQGEMQTSFGQRVAIWLAVLEVVKEHPFLGAGMGDAKMEIEKVQHTHFPDRPYILDLPHIHNQFLQAYLDSGIIAFLLLCYFFFLFFKEDFYEFDTYAKIFGITLLILFMMDTPFRFNIGVNYTLFFAAMLFGYKQNVELSRQNR